MNVQLSVMLLMSKERLFQDKGFNNFHLKDKSV